MTGNEQDVLEQTFKQRDTKKLTIGSVIGASCSKMVQIHTMMSLLSKDE